MFLNHLGDDEHALIKQNGEVKFLNHLGDDERQQAAQRTQMEFLNHLGDDEPVFLSNVIKH